jgi:prepilin-type N-terminal cleavage/methylation domain-containing protein
MKVLKRVAGGSQGFALIEVLVVIGIIGMAVGLIGNSLFQVFSVQQLWRAGVVAGLRGLRRGAR